MAFISRNPFAREELHREAVPANGHTCSWCGTERKSGRLFQYSIQADSGRSGKLNKLFCGVSCMRSYHS